MKDMRKERMNVIIGNENGEYETSMLVEVFRQQAQLGISMAPRQVECLHCGKQHYFPKESFKRVWWNHMEEYYEIHYECPVESCEGWIADFVKPS